MRDIILTYQESVADLVGRPEVLALAEFSHHRRVTRLRHVETVSMLAYLAARYLGLDARAAARGGLLHDFYLCDNCGSNFHHILNHPELAATTAGQVTDLSRREQNIILSHMWPISRHLPHCAEAWIVDGIDDLTAIADVMGLSPRLFRHLERRIGRAAAPRRFFRRKAAVAG